MSASSSKMSSSSNDADIKLEHRRDDQGSNINSSSENITEGKWLDEENVRFAIFMTLNKDVFKSKEKRKAEKIFKNVAVFLQSRSARQCRSHFQKLIKKFGTVFQMKKHYRDLVGHQKFDQIFQNCRQEIDSVKEINVPEKKEISVQTDFSEYSIFFPSSIEAYLQQYQAQLYYYLPQNLQQNIGNSY